MYSKHRIEALSDGVFAIAMTLLVLDLKAPADTAPGTLAHVLRLQFHEWISFVITFFITAVFWSFQHQVFDLLDEIGKESLALSFVFLGFVSILPFSTALWGHHIAEPVAFILYFLNQFCIAAALTLKVERARARGHLRLGLESATMRVRLYFLCAIMGIASLCSMFLPLPYISLAILPVAIAGRVLRHNLRKRAAAHALAPHPLPKKHEQEQDRNL